MWHGREPCHSQYLQPPVCPASRGQTKSILQGRSFAIRNQIAYLASTLVNPASPQMERTSCRRQLGTSRRCTPRFRRTPAHASRETVCARNAGAHLRLMWVCTKKTRFDTRCALRNAMKKLFCCTTLVLCTTFFVKKASAWLLRRRTTFAKNERRETKIIHILSATTKAKACYWYVKMHAAMGKCTGAEKNLPSTIVTKLVHVAATIESNF